MMGPNADNSGSKKVVPATSAIAGSASGRPASRVLPWSASGYAVLLAVAFLAHGCGGDGAQVSLTFVEPGPGDALFPDKDDIDPEQDGFQFTVQLTSEGLEAEDAVELLLDGESFDLGGEVSTPDAEGEIAFEKVTLPPGEHKLMARTVVASVESEEITYKLYGLFIESPQNNQRISSSVDEDGSKDGVQFTVLVKAYSIELSQDVILSIEDSDGNLVVEEEEQPQVAGTDGASSEEDGSTRVVFEAVTLPVGQLTLEARVELPYNDEDYVVRSPKHTVTVHECPNTVFVSPRPPATEVERMILGAGDDTVGEACGDDNDFGITVTVSTDAGDGQPVELFVNEVSVAKGEVEGTVAVFEQVPFDASRDPQGSDAAQTLAVEIETVDGVTCTTEFPADIVVDCDAVSCDPGYHREGGECVPDEQCTASSCSGNGTCSDSGGALTCDCDPGYAEPFCAQCATGYHYAADGDCEPDEDCSDGDPCGEHGTCSDAGGVVSCDCDDGYEGESCDRCAAGHHDPDQDDNDLECVLDTTCLPNSCDGHGECDDSTGTVQCTCDAGYQGTYCDECREGYHEVPGGDCDPDQGCDDIDPCGAHGNCVDTGGVVSCECHLGYAGGFCTDCAAGYQDADNDGVCQITCVLFPSDCSGNGSCIIDDGTARCDCDTGYTGSNCQSCATGYRRDPLEDICINCEEGYRGEDCDQCAPGYHDVDPAEDVADCALDTYCLPTSCSGHGECDDTGGVVTCDCDDGYEEPFCATCDDGYHFLANNCVLDEDCDDANPCSEHGTCDDTSGMVTCNCDVGYAPPYCDDCASGFNDHDGSCDIGCDLAVLYGLECGTHGTCSDDGVPAFCACEQGFSGASCQTCADDTDEENDKDFQGRLVTGTVSKADLVFCPGDEDWYQIELTPEDELTVRIDFTEADGNLDLYLWYPYDSRPDYDNLVASSASTGQDFEEVQYTVPADGRGTYYFVVRTARDVRNTYSLDVTLVRVGCEDCASLGVECGSWYDPCADDYFECGPCTGGAVCDEYWGICADDICDLPQGCCDGNTAMLCITPEVHATLPCGTATCGYSNSNGNVACMSPPDEPPSRDDPSGDMTIDCGGLEFPPVP